MRKPARIPRFSRNTRHESRLFFALGARRAAQPETAVRTTAPAGKPLFSSSPLFTIVHHCSPLFSKKILPAPVSSRRPVAAFLRVVARHGAAMARHGRPPSPAQATRPVRFSRITNHGFYAFHETRITQHGFYLSLRLLQGEQPQAQPTGFSRITRHETRNTAFMLPYSPFPTISRYFPALFGPPPPPQPIKGSPAVHRSGQASGRAPFAAAPAALRAASRCGER